ncbi:MAG: hypothetical protein Q8898_05485 [Bacillota bacterium]|nr:hypothetical protein [Bacillota bacterium]
MKQIIHFDDHLMDKIIHLERECENLSKRLKDQFSNKFGSGQTLVIEMVRIRKCKIADYSELFEEDYESFIEIGIETEGDYFPNAHIPLWKCKFEWLQKIGYLTNRNGKEIESTLKELLNELIEDNVRERDK